MNTEAEQTPSEQFMTLLMGTACILVGLALTLFSISKDAGTPIILTVWIVWAAVCGFVYHTETKSGVTRSWMLARDVVVLIIGLYFLNLALM